MEHSFLPRSLWTSEGKFLHHHATDLYTSVHVTRDIPAGAQFGPCVLQNTFYDTIAFIALKSSEKRSKSYVFRLDPEAMRSSALVLSWLRLVQAARGREEQNTEAFLKGGQLYFRTTRDIRQEEELLVWYDQELSHLLGFTDISTRGRNDEFTCAKCNLVFENEHPYLAHCRFLCAQVKNDAQSREAYEHKHMEIKRQHRITDFHNIARDLEHKRPGINEDAEISTRKRKHEETDYPRWRKPVLLEKNNISNDNNITQITRDYHTIAPESTGSALKPKTEKYPFKKDHVECTKSAFTEVGAPKNSLKHEKEKPTEAESETVRKMGCGLNSNTTKSAFSFVLRSGQEEQKSAFCKPSKITSNGSIVHSSNMLRSPSNSIENARDVFTSKTVLGYNNLLTSNMLNGDLTGAQTIATTVTANTFPYAPEQWSRNIGAQLQSTSSLTILPPTFTSFGVSVQNWCAKCNLSFRMTSDLVFHMRSHHKKEFAAESHVRRRREEKLTCPICQEFFRERHHLSRHMTSHN
ncbi:PR domain zinc finger protein 8 [Esox lucius]|uniref:PR domain containing 8 n=1 Tax=Esox lucius TaxID=8010 RepID=A0A3P8ZV12_ESOLU|nr:PR domain zinc finger protein 8 [Esox lucius]